MLNAGALVWPAERADRSFVSQRPVPTNTQTKALPGAVFLSYASQDTEAATGICEALRAAGVEVWFDKSELRGGDAWDRRIRTQIKDCALFVPVISENTQARAEGYFRLEWKLAVDRSHLLADDHPFLFPVVIGDVADAAARVPEKFREVQWTRLGPGEAPGELAGRVARLLSGMGAPGEARGGGRRREGAPSAAKTRRVPVWLWAVLAMFVGAVLYLTFRPRRSPEEIAKLLSIAQTVADRADQTQGVAGPPTAAAPLSEARQLVLKARALFEGTDVTNRENMLLAEQICDKAVALDPADAEVWAARAQLSYEMLGYGHDRTAARLQAMDSDAQRALALSPSSYEARLATAFAFTRQPERRAEGEKLYRSLLKENPTDRRALRNFGHLQRYLGHNDEAFALYDRAAAVTGGDPIALADKANAYYFLAKLPEAEKAAEQSLAQAPSGRAYLIITLLQLVLHGDVDRARDSLAKVPVETLRQNRGVNIATLVWLWRREPEHAFDFLRTIPQDFIEDIYFTGPKLVLTGRAQQLAGHEEAARADWSAALAMLDDRGTAGDLDSMVVRCELLARLGRVEEAGRVFVRIEQDQGDGWRRSSVGALKLLILLGRTDEAIALIPGLIGSPGGPVQLTRQVLQLDPSYDPIRADPRFKALNAEPAKDAGPGPSGART
jgi:Tfp pilus assembly protein PilF